MFADIKNIAKAFNHNAVLADVSVSINRHETISILGKSGCGKSTLLRIIAGIETADAGKIILDGSDISGQNPNQRNIVYLFQEALLFPHFSVFENIAFGLRIRKGSDKAIREAVEAMLHSLGLVEHSSKMPHQLSGGQKQRVAFGRALIINPPLILLDEPFSSLDTEIRSQMQELYKKVAAEFSITAFFVTHDIKEALLMGDRLAYMQNGRLTMYENKDAFIKDEITGAKKEISFWNNL